VKFTIDASVFVASARSDEPNYLMSRKSLREAQTHEIYCPTLVLAECSAAIARQTGDPSLAEELVCIIEDFPRINLISLDIRMARKAAQIAEEHRLRGADAVYVAVAVTFNAALISWDREMLKRCPPAVETMTPNIWCQAR
jgi:predicted nucleic acid-binding protein